MKIKYNNTCYVLLKTDSIHPIAYKRHDLIWYPETAMNLLDCIQYVPYIKSVVTENPWIIACYDCDHVQLWSIEYKRWIYPNTQTYGASVNHIRSSILGIHQTIPSVAFDGGKSIKKLRKELTYA